MSLLKKAYHPQDSALVVLHEPANRGSIDCTVASRPQSSHKPQSSSNKTRQSQIQNHLNIEIRPLADPQQQQLVPEQMQYIPKPPQIITSDQLIQ